MARRVATTDRPSRYDLLLSQQAKRKSAIQKMHDTGATTRSAIVSHINNVANGQVRRVEQVLRSRSGVNKRV